MSGRPRVSVVLIFLDAEEFLDEAIASVVAQSLGEWELLLVDDGSTDGGTALAKRWAGEMGGRIRYLAHEGHRNLGMSASRNLGLDAAAGDLVTFLDADDVLRPDALRNLVELLDAAPAAAMAYAPVEYWYGWAPERQPARRDFVQRLGVPAPAVIEPPDLLVRFLSRRAAAPSGVMVRTEVARLVGGFEQAFRGMYEDQAFCAKICLRWPVATGPAAGYRYRQHDRSSSALADRSGQHEYGREAFLGWLGDYLRREGVDHGALTATLRRERWWLGHPRAHKLARRLRRVWRRLRGR
jgi:glycosyltransferase involved in cell wall biosynthesis